MEKLTREELIKLIRAVFPSLPTDRGLAIITDFPRNVDEDNPDWTARRIMAKEWAAMLRESPQALGLERVEFVGYESVGSQNADLPETFYVITGPIPATAEGLAEVGQALALEKVYMDFQLLLAPTEFSTTAPLKIAAPKYRFRAATMPGFTAGMVPALRLDYGEINRRCLLLKEKLDAAEKATVIFAADDKEYDVQFDLRFRSAHASTGRFPEPGTAGNLPSGETYIVPYEGEMDEQSATNGVLPVQFEDEVVLYRLEQNRAVAVQSSGKVSAREAEKLRREPAYGNMAELGFGVLADFGLKPVGKILLDEKLGFHVAFGRSDHFGGIVSPHMFSSPAAVEHTDRVYIPEMQPRVLVRQVELVYKSGRKERIMQNGRYSLWQER